MLSQPHEIRSIFGFRRETSALMHIRVECLSRNVGANKEKPRKQTCRSKRQAPLPRLGSLERDKCGVQVRNEQISRLKKPGEYTCKEFLRRKQFSFLFSAPKERFEPTDDFASQTHIRSHTQNSSSNFLWLMPLAYALQPELGSA